MDSARAIPSGAAAAAGAAPPPGAAPAAAGAGGSCPRGSKEYWAAALDAEERSKLAREQASAGREPFIEAERALKTIITVKEQEGAKAIVLACTELEMVVDVDANVLPIYDCTRIHAEAAANWILGAA